MQSDNGVVTVASNPTAPAANLNDAAAAQKADFVRLFAGAGNSTDGGLISQLTSNPLFTAVSLPFSIVAADLD